MANKHYESVVIINASLEDEVIDATVKKVKDTITENGGAIEDLDNWGRKRLAYPINKAKSGFYVVIRFIAPAEMITKLERFYRLDESIIRFLTIALEKKDLQHYADLANRKEEEAKEAAAAEEAAAAQSEKESEEAEKTEENAADSES